MPDIAHKLEPLFFFLINNSHKLEPSNIFALRNSLIIFSFQRKVIRLGVFLLNKHKENSSCYFS